MVGVEIEECGEVVCVGFGVVGVGDDEMCGGEGGGFEWCGVVGEYVVED